MRPVHFIYRLVSGFVLIMLMQDSWTAAAGGFEGV